MAISQHLIHVRDYDLAATLTSGQAFRWNQIGDGWEGIVGRRWVRLEIRPNGFIAQTAGDPDDWNWLENYLQTRVDLDSILSSFPDDEPMRAAVDACRGLRLLRQEPWECLASFILSSTKQIVQIRQIVEALCQRYGEPVPTPVGRPAINAFPSAERIAALSEAELRACKMGFRAPKLLATARLVASGAVRLEKLGEVSLTEASPPTAPGAPVSHPAVREVPIETRRIGDRRSVGPADADALRGDSPLEKARAELLRCPGVGEKIANCVLLFACGFPDAFPVDVWVMKAMRELYFPKRRPQPARLRRFIATHFGPNAGWAQQYLFHYMRVKKRRTEGTRAAP